MFLPNYKKYFLQRVGEMPDRGKMKWTDSAPRFWGSRPSPGACLQALPIYTMGLQALGLSVSWYTLSAGPDPWVWSLQMALTLLLDTVVSYLWTLRPPGGQNLDRQSTSCKTTANPATRNKVLILAGRRS